MAAFRETCALTSRIYAIEFFTSKRPFGGYFQWKASTYFQKICSWTSYSNAIFIKNIWNAPPVLHQKNNGKIKVFGVFLQLIGTLLWLPLTKCVLHLLPKKCRWISYSNAKLMKNISNFLITLLRFALEKQFWSLSFHSFFITKRIVVATFKKCVHSLPENTYLNQVWAF